jgi:hypothetical protein
MAEEDGVKTRRLEGKVKKTEEEKRRNKGNKIIFYLL